MPADPSTKVNTPSSRKRSLTSKRGAIACVRCKERKAKCVPAPPGTSNVPTCTNCFASRAECIYLERTPNELFLLEYVSQLEARVALLEIELAKYNPSSQFTSDHSQPLTAAVESLTRQYPQGSYQLVVGGDGQTLITPDSGERNVSGSNLQVSGKGVSEGSGSSGNRVEEIEDEKAMEEGEDLAMGIGLLSLSGSGEPLYVGASSGVNWARVCATALRRPRSRHSNLSRFSYQAPPELASLQSALSYTTNHPTPPLPPPALANRYLSVVYMHIQARYGCFDWPAVRIWHTNRQEICQNRPIFGAGQGEDQRRLLASFFLWLCYGFGARLTEDEHLEGAVSHEVYYNTAVACLSTLTSQHSLATVQALLLLTIYSFRHSRAELSIWQVGGLALRTAVELGLHRRTRSKVERERDPLRYEMKKRVFWTLYTLDRMMALQLGRPSGIQDRDIDVDLPLNIDVDFTDAKTIFAMQNRQIEMTTGRRPGDEYNLGYDSITSMTSSIHNIRLNQLKQDIQDAIYRLDTPVRRRSKTFSQDGKPLPDIDSLLTRFAQWKSCHPILPPGRAGVPLLSKEHFDMEYHNCVQMLLRPVISGSKIPSRYTAVCAESAAALCEIQYDLLCPSPELSRLSTWALYRLFLSGLTLLHIASSSSPKASPIDMSRAARALYKCQDSLTIFSRTFPGAKGYEACFEELVSAWEARGQASLESPSVMSHNGGHREIGGSGNFVQTPQYQPSSVPSMSYGNNGVLFPYHEPSLSPAGGIYTASSSPSNYYSMNRQQPQHQHQNNLTFNLPTSMTSPLGGIGEQGVSLGSSASSQNLNESTMPLLGSSPTSTEAFSDLWAGRLGEMGGRLGGGMRDDFFSLMSSFGLDTVLESVEETLPAIGEDQLWTTSDWDNIAAQSQSSSRIEVSPSMCITGGGGSGNGNGMGMEMGSSGPEMMDDHAGMGEWLGFLSGQGHGTDG